MTDAELGKRLDLLRAKGVSSYAEHGGLSVVFGPLPSEPRRTDAKEKQEDEPIHPADLVANPPNLGGPVEEV